MARIFYILITSFLFAVCSHASTKIVISSECEGKKKCDIKPPEYEQHQENINKQLENSRYFRYESEDIDDIPDADYGDPENCESQPQIVNPYTVQVSGNRVNSLMVVQTQRFQQRIRVTKCRTKEKTACFQSVTTFQTDLKAHCVQRTANITLLVYDVDKNKIMPQVFEDVEVGCVCEVSFNSDTIDK